jgi:hypothetical protein
MGNDLTHALPAMLHFGLSCGNEFYALLGAGITRRKTDSCGCCNTANALIDPVGPFSMCEIAFAYVNYELQSCGAGVSSHRRGDQKLQSREARGTNGMAISVNPSVIACGWTGMAIGGRPIAGFGPGIAKRVPGYRAANPPGWSVLVSYSPSLRHFRVSHGDPVESSVCSRDLRCVSLLRDFVDPALVASEAPKLTNAMTSTRKS